MVGEWFASYGGRGVCSLMLDTAMTRVLFPGARLVRRPIYIRGRRWIDFGPRFSTGRCLRIDAFGKKGCERPLIRFGRDVRLNDYVHIGAVNSVEIGDRVLIASKVFISDHSHGSYGRDGVHSDPLIAPYDRVLSSAPVLIEEDVWIGEFVSVLPGVRIGKGSVIGTMSTVSKDIPPYSVAVGSPARVIKRFNFESAQWEQA
jgi:acetyltransferase-like isoleucine patch superfamily enzyme